MQGKKPRVSTDPGVDYVNLYEFSPSVWGEFTVGVKKSMSLSGSVEALWVIKSLGFHLQGLRRPYRLLNPYILTQGSVETLRVKISLSQALDRLEGLLNTTAWGFIWLLRLIKSLCIGVSELIGLVRNVVLINVYLDLENQGGSGFRVGGYMSQMREWRSQFTSNLGTRWTDPITATRVPSKWRRGARGSKGEQGEYACT